MKLKLLALRPLARATVAAAALAGAASTWAENHALIVWIGDYGDPKSNLPGIERDAANARQLAIAVGVPEQNIAEISNAALTRANIGTGLNSLYARIKDGDKVLHCYSGHGGQFPGRGTAANCSEVLVARDGLVLEVPRPARPAARARFAATARAGGPSNA